MHVLRASSTGASRLSQALHSELDWCQCVPLSTSLAWICEQGELPLVGPWIPLWIMVVIKVGARQLVWTRVRRQENSLKELFALCLRFMKA